MTRYFFHLHDGKEYLDKDGAVFATLDEARAEAIRSVSDHLRDMSQEFWSGDIWTMQVQDEYGITVCELMFSAK